MRTLLASELLAIWETGMAQPPVQRALALLAAAFPEHTLGELARLSIGQRDACLLRLRAQTFGSQLASLATCRSCRMRLELTFDVADILMPSEVEPEAIFAIHRDGYDIKFRLPNSLDMAAGDQLADAVEIRTQLLERCVLAATYNGATCHSHQLPSAVVEAVTEQMTQIDPQANILLTLTCPACGEQWKSMFDVVNFFWNEICAWAPRVLRDVHMLASRYGWREADILAMSAWRRQYYLSMVSG